MASYGNYNTRGPPRGRGAPRGPRGGPFPRGRPILTPEQDALIDRLPTTIYVSPIELPFSQKQAETVFSALGKVRGAATSTMASGEGCARIEFHKATTAHKAVMKSEQFKVGPGKPPVIEWSDFDVQGRPLPLPTDNLLFRNTPPTWSTVEDCKSVLTNVKKVMRLNREEKMLIMFDDVFSALENWEKHSDTILPGANKQAVIGFAVPNNPYVRNPIKNHLGLGKSGPPASERAPPHSGSGNHESRSERDRDRDSRDNRDSRRDREREERRSDRDRDGYSRSSRRDEKDREYSRREKSSSRTTVVVPPPTNGPSPAELVHIQDQVRAMLNVQAPEASATVSFTGLHPNMSELFVFNVCSIFGAIHKIESNAGAARIHFSRRSDAETCVSRLNGTKVGENPWALMIEAPPQPAYQPAPPLNAPTTAAPSAYTGYGGF